MATDSETAVIITGILSGAGNATCKKMFGEYGVYLEGKFIGCVCDNALFFKITKVVEKNMPELEKAPPYPGAKPCFCIDDFSNSERICKIARQTYENLPLKKDKK